MRDINYLKKLGVDVDSSIELFGDIEMYDETIEDFIASIEDKTNKLTNAKDSNNLENYGIFAHSIKSDARYLGFIKLYDVALIHENAGKSLNQQFVNENYEYFMTQLNDMILVCKNYINSSTDNSENIKKQFVIVDDSSLVTNLIEKSLNEKFDILVFNDSEIALDYILKSPNNIDGILLDLNMPVVDGFKILEAMKENDLFKDIKVSIITGDESREAIDKSFSYPIVDILEKPFSIDRIKNIAEKTLSI